MLRFPSQLTFCVPCGCDSSARTSDSVPAEHVDTSWIWGKWWWSSHSAPCHAPLVPRKSPAEPAAAGTAPQAHGMFPPEVAVYISWARVGVHVGMRLVLSAEGVNVETVFLMVFNEPRGNPWHKQTVCLPRVSSRSLWDHPSIQKHVTSKRKTKQKLSCYSVLREISCWGGPSA